LWAAAAAAALALVWRGRGGARRAWSWTLDPLAEAAEAAAAGARRDLRDPLTRVRALEALRPQIAELRAEAGGVLDDDAGTWVPEALQRWSRTIVHVREPVDIGGEQSVAAWITAHLGAADCDCLARAVATWARSCGCGAQIGVYPVPGGGAHAVCAVTPGWDGAAADRGWLVVDRASPGLVEADFAVGTWVMV
jgi:hypothetical protein